MEVVLGPDRTEFACAEHSGARLGTGEFMDEFRIVSGPPKEVLAAAVTCEGQRGRRLFTREHVGQVVRGCCCVSNLELQGRANIDLRADRYELTNLATDPAYQELVLAMRAALTARGVELQDPFSQ